VEVVTYRPFFILGEVRAAGQYPFVSGLTVEAAVAIAGGYTARANEREVRIARNVGGEAADLLVPVTDGVRPGDTIYVRERWF
jgi:polysaccharide biosynthesis/export protein